MDPINRSNRPNRPQTPQTNPTQKSDKAQGAANFNPNAGNVKGGQEAGQTAPVPTPNFNRVQSRIADGVKRNLSKEQIMTDLVDDESRRAFGDDVSEKVVESVAEAFESDKVLKQLFDKLYRKAIGEN